MWQFEELVELIPLTVDSAVNLGFRFLFFVFFFCVLSDEISINIYTLYIYIYTYVYWVLLPVVFHRKLSLWSKWNFNGIYYFPLCTKPTFVFSGGLMSWDFEMTKCKTKTLVNIERVNCAENLIKKLRRIWVWWCCAHHGKLSRWAES